MHDKVNIDLKDSERSRQEVSDVLHDGIMLGKSVGHVGH